jgi:hypothetical protein
MMGVTMTRAQAQMARAHGMALRDLEHPEAGWQLVRRPLGGPAANLAVKSRKAGWVTKPPS